MPARCKWAEQVDTTGVGAYEEVDCLLLRWDDKLDKDLRCREELDKLEDLLRTGFRFTTTTCVLNADADPQVQLRGAVDTVVGHAKSRHRHRLVIVYYTGHGNGRADGELIISGTCPASCSKPNPAYWPQASWQPVDVLLSDANVHVLTILDCCHAGVLGMKGGVERQHPHEVLAACEPEGRTRRPGRHSFTRALVDVLREEAGEGQPQPFSIACLNDRIVERRKGVPSYLFDRRVRGDGTQIVLAPLPPVPREALHEQVEQAGVMHAGQSITH